MKSTHSITAVLVLLLCGQFLRGQDMDRNISTMASDLVTAINGQSKRKVAVLDFTDLDGNSSEFGKYVAEQLTVDLVMARHNFSVLDRANLRKILDEHKLTATGLVVPDNARKLGQLAGVDALILGTETPRKQNVEITAKIITTDTAEIVGAAKAQITLDDSVQQMLAQPGKEAGTSTPPDQASDIDKSLRKPFGDLEVHVESFRFALPRQAPPSIVSGLLPSDGPVSPATITLIITNTSRIYTYGVGFAPQFYGGIHLRNDRQDYFEVTDLEGIGTVFDRGNGVYVGSFTDIAPSSYISVVIRSHCYWRARPGDYRPYRLQTLVTFGTESKGLYSNVRKYNLILDIK